MTRNATGIAAIAILRRPTAHLELVLVGAVLVARGAVGLAGLLQRVGGFLHSVAGERDLRRRQEVARLVPDLQCRDVSPDEGVREKSADPDEQVVVATLLQRLVLAGEEVHLSLDAVERLPESLDRGFFSQVREGPDVQAERVALLRCLLALDRRGPRERDGAAKRAPDEGIAALALQRFEVLPS